MTFVPTTEGRLPQGNALAYPVSTLGVSNLWRWQALLKVPCHEAPLAVAYPRPASRKAGLPANVGGVQTRLCVSQIGQVTSYDLLPSFKPRKGQEHRLVGHLAEQLKQGWTMAVWDVERLLRELELVVEGVSITRPTLKAAVDEAWHLISSADEEQIVDLKLFERLPGGHYVAMVAFREDFDFDAYPPRRRRQLMASSRQSRPVCEDFWGVLHSFLMKKSDAQRAWSAYQRWVRNNRPPPPLPDTT